jgi:hypothetical protein
MAPGATTLTAIRRGPLPGNMMRVSSEGIGLGVRCTAASIGSAETQRDPTPAFSPHREFVNAPVASLSRWAVCHAVLPLFVDAARPRARSTRIVTLTAQSTMRACRYPSAARKASLLTIEFETRPPHGELKRHKNCSSVRSRGKRVSFTPSTRGHSTASSTNCPYS